jgi:hypothetical protein
MAANSVPSPRAGRRGCPPRPKTSPDNSSRTSRSPQRRLLVRTTTSHPDGRSTSRRRSSPVTCSFASRIPGTSPGSSTRRRRAWFASARKVPRLVFGRVGYLARHAFRRQSHCTPTAAAPAGDGRTTTAAPSRGSRVRRMRAPLRARSSNDRHSTSMFDSL